MWLDTQQWRDFIALLCRVAVRSRAATADREWQHLAALLFRVGEGRVDAAEIAEWLSVGPPALSATLPESAKPVFYAEAIQLIGSDGDFDPQDMLFVRELLRHHFARTAGG